MSRLRYALALVLAWAAGYAMRRQPPAPCPDVEPRVAVSTAGEVVDLRELQRSSYRAGEADGRAASLGDALRLAGNSQTAWLRGYRAGWEESAAACPRGARHGAMPPAPGLGGPDAVDRP